MRRSHLIPLVAALLCAALLSAPGLALETRASSQISSYDISVSAGSSGLATDFDVRGTGVMTKLGCQSIAVQEKAAKFWTPVYTIYENEAGMSRTNSTAHSNVIYSDSEAGVQYRVIVTVFAEDTDGRDTRSQTFYVTGTVNT